MNYVKVITPFKIYESHKFKPNRKNDENLE